MRQPGMSHVAQPRHSRSQPDPSSAWGIHIRQTSAIAALAVFSFAAAGCTDILPVEPGAVLPRVELPPAVPHPEHARFLQAAAIAWQYVEPEYQPATGLINSVAGYPYATVWDMASGLAALYCAERLGLLNPWVYDARMRRALTTLESLPLFDGITYNKNYSTTTGRPAGLNDRDSSVTERGYGWSSVDLGRLLIWLGIVADEHPRFAPQIARIVARSNFRDLVRDGYLEGGELDVSGAVRRYSEGRLGYEQYAAAGFAAWGGQVDNALSLSRNTFAISVMGVPLLADLRGGDYLTSEPFLLMGLESGWQQDTRDLATQVLRVQEQRYQRTGQLTVVSEDNLPVAPFYFYYYAINHHGQQFAVGAPDGGLIPDGPRWLSAKAAWGWHALLPSDYTARVVGGIAPAADPTRGWGAGVYEGTGLPIGGYSLNTAAVILEAALFSRTGRPLLWRNQALRASR